MAELAPEDALRLNVMLARKPQAVRIHENSMTVFGLTENGEASIKLNSNCREEQYLKAVRELLSGHVLGSPGGYPVFLRRWTRMGQMRDENLDQLLLLGEPEAVVAVVCAKGLTDELARRAWWAMDDADNARRMLERSDVVGGKMGKELAAYLVEHLAFETEPEKQIATVRLVLQAGLIDEDQRATLWRKANQKRVYKLGFLMSQADSLPEPSDPRPDYEQWRVSLAEEISNGNPVAQHWLRALSGAGQTYLRTVDDVLAKPNNQDVVNTLMDVVGGYFRAIRAEGDPDQEIDALQHEAALWVADNAHAKACVSAGIDVDALIALRVLSGLGYGVVRPIFARTTAIGSVMRKRLKPVSDQINAHLRLLR